MKKKYINPTTTFYTLASSERMLETSPTSPNVSSDPIDIGTGGNYAKDDEEFGW